MAGLYFEEFQVGQEFHHEFSRTVTEMDNTMFSLLTMNPQPLHLDAHFAEKTEYGQRLFNSRWPYSVFSAKWASRCSGCGFMVKRLNIVLSISVTVLENS